MFSKKIKKAVVLSVLALFVVFFVWQYFKAPATTGDWQTPLAIQAKAIFNNNLVSIENVRNFRYSSDEKEDYPNYYNQTYDLDKLDKVWYVVDPFKETQYAAHTFLSFEFSDNKFLSISIEARKLKGQTYSVWQGLLKSYPLMYIVADERDTILMRANIRKDDVYLYPVKITHDQAKILFKDMLMRMNELAQKPTWYNTITANCTSAIAWHINKIWPGRLPAFLWQSWVSGFAEKFVFENKLLDTDLSLQNGRKKYYITNISQKIGDVPDYSRLIRQFN